MTLREKWKSFFRNRISIYTSIIKLRLLLLKNYCNSFLSIFVMINQLWFRQWLGACITWANLDLSCHVDHMMTLVLGHNELITIYLQWYVLWHKICIKFTDFVTTGLKCLTLTWRTWWIERWTHEASEVCHLKTVGTDAATYEWRSCICPVPTEAGWIMPQVWNKI